MLRKIFATILMIAALAACNLVTAPASPTPGPTVPPVPTVPPPPTGTAETPPASIHIAVRGTDGSIQIVDTGIALDPSAMPVDNGFLQEGGFANGTEYALDFTNGSVAQASDAGGTRTLGFIQNANYGLAVLPGSGPRLAWGTQLVTPSNAISLNESAPDGSAETQLLTETVDPNLPYELVAERWSADGQSLYFSREPFGIGGYIPFMGASSLFRLDLADHKVTELIPFTMQSGPVICLDAFSSDDNLVADHCSGQIHVRNLSTGQTTVIQPPADAVGFSLTGSARFSPDNTRVAYALAKADPNAEQGWVAISDSLNGSSKLVLTGKPGENDLVLAWLNATTLLIQTNQLTCSPTCVNTVWTVSLDGTRLTKVTDGSFLNLVIASQP